MADKMSRKELKQPDSFQKVGGDARDWLAERQKLVATIAGAILAIGLIASLAHYFSTRGDERLAGTLGQTLEPLTRPVLGRPGAEAGEKTFNSQREKDEAVRNAAAEFRKSHTNGRAAATAAFALAHAELHLANADAALPVVEAYLRESSGNDVLRASGLEAKGYIYEAKGEVEKALAAFDELAKENKSDFLSGMGLYHRARLLVQQNKKEEAAQIFKDVQTSFPNTAAARMSGERLATLAAEGVKPPVAPAPETKTPDAG